METSNNYMRWLGVLALPVLASVASLAPVAANATDTCSEMPTSGNTYYIINKGSGLALDVNTNDDSDPTNVITYDFWAPSNQKFKLTKQSDGYWEITSVYNGNRVEVLDASTSNGANVDTYEDWDGDNQRWELKVQSTGGFKIVNKNSSLSLTVAGSTDGSNVYQNEDESESSQRWYINPVSGSCGDEDSDSDSSSDDDLIGFASQSGDDGLSTTTGGASGSTVTVSSCSDLKTYLTSSTAYTIQIPDDTTIDCRTSGTTATACELDCSYWNDDGKTWYRIPTSAQTCSDFDGATGDTSTVTRYDKTIKVASNKTLVGLGSGSKLVGASLDLDGVENVIIQNLTITNINPSLVEAGDGITVDDSSHVWIDHVAFSYISDGYVDIGDSQNVTVSWNRFYGSNEYVCGSQHWYTNLVEDSEVTFHHNFWDTAAGRNPKVKGSESRVHLFNNYWKDISYFSIGGSDEAQLLVESNYFEDSYRPQWNIDGDALFSASGNTYTGNSTDTDYQASGDTVFSDVDMYSYTLDDTSDLGDEVDGGTGPQD